MRGVIARSIVSCAVSFGMSSVVVSMNLVFDFFIWLYMFFFFFSSRRRHTRYWRDWSSDVCSSDLLVLADTSAVVFSANPITGNREEVVVTASWGLGESVVSGTVTPDTWVVRKSDLAVKEERIGAKERMTVAVPGGTREVAVPRLLRGRASLNGAQVAELARLAVELEEEMGRPVDIEAAFAGDLLYLLQSRPITTLGEPDKSISAVA